MLDLKDDVPALIENSAPQDLDLYIEWSRLDFKDEPRRDARAESREIVKVLEKKGYGPVTREVADGTGWGGWRLRTDRILESLFPLEKTPWGGDVQYRCRPVAVSILHATSNRWCRRQDSNLYGLAARGF